VSGSLRNLATTSAGIPGCLTGFGCASGSRTNSISGGGDGTGTAEVAVDSGGGVLLVLEDDGAPTDFARGRPGAARRRLTPAFGGPVPPNGDGMGGGGWGRAIGPRAGEPIDDAGTLSMSSESWPSPEVVLLRGR